MSTAFPSPAELICVVADPARCVGAGQCVLTDPTTFDQTDDGTVVLLRDTLPPSAADRIAEALARCPSRALRRV